MRILITGKGTSGSWQVRGVQLGAEIGAVVEPMVSGADGFDVVVLVKRPPSIPLPRTAPLVWDIVDAFPQPKANTWTRDECMAWLRTQVAAIRPDGIVAATETMATDCAKFGVPVLWLPHHARPGLRQNPIRPLNVIGYEGSEAQLGRWRAVAESECADRGWKFVINPKELADVDVVLALRDSYGYAPRNWKSNVKLANAQVSGTPVICGREAGYLETQSGAERWADTPHELHAALNELERTEVRFAASRRLKESAPTIDRVATQYLAWLRANF